MMDMIKGFFGFLVGIYKERKIILNLAINDFKSKFTNSLLGMIWGFLLPLLTIFVLWYVFEIGLKSGTVKDVPFMLYYIPAYIAWNFFTEAFSGCCNCLIEYSYMVKKMRFRVSVIPIVKIISSGFVHVFFIGVVVIIYLIYGYRPSIYNIQVLYYLFALCVLLIGFGWLSSAMAVFAKDTSNIVAVILQVGFWATPIIWSTDIMSESVIRILELNPMYYICNGYRDCFLYHKWFWENPGLTIYFWSFTLVIFVIGANLFKRLRAQFADVI